ncbi:MAG: ACP S-malonyltransferase [Nitrospiraceae bacterium]|nr:ACP S-malonyltransferase [Nitrospiraceae bacterium]
MKLAFVFPGQGSQKVGMGADLHAGFRQAREIYDEASQVLGFDVARLSFEGPAEELDLTINTQPCLLAAEYAACRVLETEGVKPALVAGHSLGEYTAAVVSGALGFSAALRTTRLRAKLMQEAVPAGRGMMAAILGLSGGAVDEICAGLGKGYARAANYNCPGQVVISGEADAVREAMALAGERGAKRAIPLQVSVPSHSRLMEGAAEKLAEFLSSGVEITPPAIPLISNAGAVVLGGADEVRDALVRQLANPVRWEESLRVMRSAGAEAFIEVGPGRVLSGLLKRTLPECPSFNVEDRQSLEKTLRGLAGPTSP